jgi:prevent-host-death family protein
MSKRTAPRKTERESRMTMVGVRELKDQLSEYLRRVSAGERIVVTDRGRPIATLAPFEEASSARALWGLVAAGLASWKGGKPKAMIDPPVVKGASVADAVLEDREDRA